MSSLVLTGDTSGQVTISAPAVAGSNTLTLQAATATMSVNTLGTAVPYTSFTTTTYHDFTSIPSWAKRITVILAGITPASSVLQIQIGDSGGIATTGYVSTAGRQGLTSNDYTTSTTAFVIQGAATGAGSGNVFITTVGSNIWSYSSTIAGSGGQTLSNAGGTKTLTNTLDRIRFTTAAGATFSAGTINIMYEG